MQLDQYCKQQCIEIIQTLDDIDSTQEQLANAYETSLKIFKLYIFRLEHGNPEEWFQEVVIELFQGAMSEMMVNVYYERQVNYLLRSPFIKNKIQGDWTHLIDLMNDIVTKYDCWTKSKKRRVDVEEEEEEFEYEEEEEFEYEEEEVHVEECERESFM
ncbi:hypothetical protein BDF21DRAFT_433893 [Thamnidium elegans]|nr:hypothetical protein BDF21DRAFT_433893 [Thamnidium elegans]